MSTWRCTNCGYSYLGDEIIDNCPSCQGHCTFVNKSTDCSEDIEECQKGPDIKED